MYPLKQSTTVTIPFFLHDANGDAVNSKVDGDFTKKISKNGGAFAAMTGGEAATATFMEAGWYSLALTSTNTNTLGVTTIYLTVAGAKQVNLQFRIFAVAFDDLVRSAVPANALSVDTGNRAKADLERWRGSEPLTLSSSLPRVQVDTHLAAAKVEIADQVAAELDEAIPELASVPSATPSIRNALMLLYMTVRNQLVATSSLKKIHNDAGTVIAKATLTEDAGTQTFTVAKLVNGP